MTKEQPPEAAPLRHEIPPPPETRHSTLSLTALARYAAKSGYFPDAHTEAQAAVKIQAGLELGFGPIASVTGIRIIQGQVTIGANLIAAAIKRSDRYDYEIVEHTEEICTIRFIRVYLRILGTVPTEIGTSSFSMADARQADLHEHDNWKGYPRNMLFARAISNGAKWFCPDIFSGPIYTPDELGAEVDGETGQPIDPEPEPEPERRPPPSGTYTSPTGQMDAAGNVQPPTQSPPPETDAEPTPHQRLQNLISEHNITGEQIAAWCKFFGRERIADISEANVESISTRIETQIEGGA